MTYILGLSAFYHDSAVTLIKDGQIVCALQEERFSRIKQDRGFPRHALRACLEQAGISLADVAWLAYYEDPEVKFERICTTYKRNFPRGALAFAQQYTRFAARRDIKGIINTELQGLFPDQPLPAIFISQHHLSHAASAFYPSPYQEAAVLCVDGVGEWSTTTAWQGKGNQLEPLFEVRFPHSLGLLYSAFTYYCGFKVDSGEYKLMGLAPYGEPRFVDTILEHLITLEEDGSFSLNRKYFDYEVGERMISTAFETLFGAPAREPESPIGQREMDLAASIQVVTERVMLALARRIKAQTQADYLCLAGGVALNCVANGKLLRSGLFKGLFVQPASGDSGGSLGAALHCHYQTSQAARQANGVDDAMQGAYLGNAYDSSQIERTLNHHGAPYQKLDRAALLAATAAHLAEDKVVGWFQGRMEFGPRSLGARSILGNPRSATMQSVMNLKIKNRESFRPFAPAVLAEQAGQWFELDTPSPYMLIVAPVHAQKRMAGLDERGYSGIEKLQLVRSQIPAVTHVDCSARVQTVDGRHNPLFRDLLASFADLTGCPVLINTSFNVRGEPIVESPEDAYRCFMRTEMDCLVLGDYLLVKAEQPHWHEVADWRSQYALD
ncbi:carbamoyltransferase [Pseudomonas entomophila]|uniref:carbamoyltransferase family protein n=1 Tax=Pseudomonas entomophila TaxID=312306 RepID=UPI002404EA6C|nr:carbamoyltransferase [Pseudomonas entomophila]MDF9619784.1 carbamoyltransferase [Pseudomonas entomophila]